MHKRLFVLVFLGFLLTQNASTAMATTAGPKNPQPGMLQLVFGRTVTPEFLEWLSWQPRVSASGRVCWTGLVVFDSREWPESIETTADPLPGAPCGIVFLRISLAGSMSEADARYFIRGELAKMEVWEWLLDQSYLDLNDPEFITLVDGLGYFRVVVSERATEYQMLAHPLQSWDARSEPTCRHLLAIQNLHEISFVAGPGIQNLLTREGCL